MTVVHQVHPAVATTTISGSISSSSTVSSSSLSKSISETTIEGIKYIAAIPTDSSGETSWVEIDEDGDFSLIIDLNAYYIFKLLDEYGLPEMELAFGDEDNSVYSVQSSTDFGDIEISENDTTATIDGLTANSKDSSNIIEEIVNTSLIGVITGVLADNGLGSIDDSTNNIEITLIINEEENDDGSSVQQRVSLTLENDSAEYGELDFSDSIEVSIATVDSEGNDLSEVSIYTCSDYLNDDSSSSLGSSTEELIKISSLIEELTDTTSESYSDFEAIAASINSGNDLSDSCTTYIDTNDYDSIIELAESEASDVIQGELTGIEISTYPDKTEYYTGDSFDYTNLEVIGEYENDSTDTIDNSELSFSGFDNTTAGTQTITVTYGDYTTSFDITMTDLVITDIEITNEPDTTNYYTEDGVFDYTGLVVTANYNNNTTDTIDNSELSFSGFDNTTAGTQTITVTYGDYTTSFDITMIDKDISSIEVTTEPTTTHYMGDSFDYTGLVVTGTYNSSTSADLDNDTLEFSGFDSSSAGTITITVTYGSVSTSFDLSIVTDYTDTYEYTIENSEVTIDAYLGSETSLTIPDTIKGYPVTTIGYRVFEMAGIETLVLSDNIGFVKNFV